MEAYRELYVDKVITNYYYRHTNNVQKRSVNPDFVTKFCRAPFLCQLQELEQF